MVKTNEKSLHPTNQGSLYYQPQTMHKFSGEILQIYHFICSVSFPPKWVIPANPLGFPSLSWSLCASLAWRLNEGEVQDHYKYQEPFTYWHGFAYIYIYTLHMLYYIYTYDMVYYIYIYVSLCEHHTHIAMVCVGIALLIFMLHPAKAGDTFRQKKNSPGLGFHLHLERILLFTPHRVNG